MGNRQTGARMRREIRLALVGDSERLPPALLRSIAAEDVRFEAICDPGGGRVEAAARTYGARWPFDDLDQMLREAEPDAVVLAVAVDQRAAVARTCLRRKAATLILGSPGTSPGATKALAKVARTARQIVMVGLAQRYSPAAVKARRLLESGKLGRLSAVDLTVTWPRDPAREGGGDFPLPFDLVFDAADRLRSLGLQPDRIWAIEQPYGHVAAMVLAGDGVLATLGLHHAGTPQAAGNHLEVRSEDGGLLSIEDDVNMTCVVGTQPVARHEPKMGRGDDPNVECGWVGMLSAFIRAVRDEQGAPFGLPSAAGSVALATAIFKAAKKSGAVNFKTMR